MKRNNIHCDETMYFHSDILNINAEIIKIKLYMYILRFKKYIRLKFKNNCE